MKFLYVTQQLYPKDLDKQVYILEYVYIMHYNEIISILCGIILLQCINYVHYYNILYIIALNVDFLRWLPHINNIILFWVRLGFYRHNH